MVMENVSEFWQETDGSFKLDNSDFMKRLGRIIEISNGWRRAYIKSKLIELSSVTHSASPLSSASISVAQSSLSSQLTLTFFPRWTKSLVTLSLSGYFGVPLTGPIGHERTNGHPHEVLWVPVASTISPLVIGISHSGQQSDPISAYWFDSLRSPKYRSRKQSQLQI